MKPDQQLKLRALLTRQEGLRLLPYTDTTGNLTIGIGRNLTANGISPSEALMMVNNDTDYVFSKLSTNYSWFAELDENRQIALMSMAFNVGLKGFAEFIQMIYALEEKDYQLAAICMLQSKWATQVGQRAVDLSAIIRTGELDA